MPSPGLNTLKMLFHFHEDIMEGGCGHNYPHCTDEETDSEK